MEMKEWMSMTRQERLSELGTESACPFCQNPRVERSDYIRCNPCGVNWLQEEMHLPNYLNSDPRIARRELARTESAAKPIADRQADSAKADVSPYTL